MIYILIFVFISSQKSSAITVEFNSIEACRSAATEISRQVANQQSGYQSVVLCAAKGYSK